MDMFTDITLTHDCLGTCLSMLHWVAYKTLPKLRALSIRHCQLMQYAAAPCQHEIIFRLYENNPGLEELNLRGIAISDDTFDI